MKLSHLAVGLLSTGVIVGCDNDTSTTPAARTADATNEGARDAAADIQATAADAQAGAAGAMGEVRANATTAAADMGTAATDAGNAAVVQAQQLYTQASTAISGMKLDDAQKYVDQLKGLRDKLPADWQTRVDDASKMLTDARAKMGGGGATTMPR